MKDRFRHLFRLFERTGERFGEVQGYRLGASFSYFATFAIFPLVLLSVTVVGFVIGDDAQARDRLLSAVAAEGSMRQVLEQTLGAMAKSGSGRGLSAVVAFASLVFSASGTFTELDTALNDIWGNPKLEGKGLWGTITTFLKERLVSFALVGGLGLSLLASLVASSVFGAIAAHAPTGSGPLWQAIEIVSSLALLWLVFTLVFHFVPRNRPPIKEVAAGALLTTVVLTLLKTIFAAYLEKLTSYSAYGVVGGVLAMATWIYLSSMIILIGATLTRVRCEMDGVCRKSSSKTNGKATTRPTDDDEVSFADVRDALAHSK